MRRKTVVIVYAAAQMAASATKSFANDTSPHLATGRGVLFGELPPLTLRAVTDSVSRAAVEGRRPSRGQLGDGSQSRRALLRLSSAAWVAPGT
jgi:hypothetical protein